jgi:hypothetical protein
MMVSANLDLVRSIFVAWERGDFRETDWADPEIEHVFADGPNPGSFTGMAGMADGWREFLGAWGGRATRSWRTSTANLTMSECSCSTTAPDAERPAEWSLGRCGLVARTSCMFATARSRRWSTLVNRVSPVRVRSPAFRNLAGNALSAVLRPSL